MLPIYKMIVEDSEGMDFMGIVQDPANMKAFITFNKDQEDEPRKVYFANDEEQILFGVAIATDLPIYRKDKLNGEHFVIFDKDQTRKIGQKMLQNGYLHNLNFQHDENDVLEDGQLDQIFYIDKTRGVDVEAFKDMHLKDGSMIVSYKFHTKEMWSKIKKGIADGTLGGLSIEGWFDKEEVNIKRVEMSQEPGTYIFDIDVDGTVMCGQIEAHNAEEALKLATELHGEGVVVLGRLESTVDFQKQKQHKQMKKVSLWKKYFGEDKPEETKMAEAETVDGVVVMWEGELAEGTAVFIMTDEGEQLQAPEGMHALPQEDGSQIVITVDGNGLVTSMETVEASDDEPDTPEDEEEMDKEVEEVLEEMEKRHADKMSAFKEEKKEELAAAKKTIEELEAEKMTLSNQVEALLKDLDNPAKFQKRKEEMENGEVKKTYRDLLYKNK